MWIWSWHCEYTIAQLSEEKQQCQSDGPIELNWIELSKVFGVVFAAQMCMHMLSFVAEFTITVSLLLV